MMFDGGEFSVCEFDPSWVVSRWSSRANTFRPELVVVAAIDLMISGWPRQV
jgi:hypothetical protein